MAQITGRATIRVDGQELRSLGGATLNIGGVSREAVTGGGKIHGYREADEASTLECRIAHTRALSLRWLASIESATVEFETDTGVQFLMRGAFTTAVPSLAESDGAVDLSMAALECDELS
jgi:hypothetical protein